MSHEDPAAPAPLDAVVELFAAGPVAVLTGAGISTDSGIPDYRGTGGLWRGSQSAPPRTPMSIDQFMHDEAYRRRFWAGARIGALRTADIEPNEGHLALAGLEALGRTTGVITQNVDDLHRLAGSREVVELHGNGSVIRCVRCRHRSSRQATLARFDELNPGYAEQHRDAEAAPDGDARVGDISGVLVPSCEVCGGLLRPNVVYFGETVPPEVFAAAERQLAGAAALLVAGTSLAVNTGIRLVHRAERAGLPIAVINRGPTAIDARPSVVARIDGGTSEALGAILARVAS